MDEPIGVRHGMVDARGRLKLPQDVRSIIERHPEWFIVQGDNSLCLQTALNSGQRVEVDLAGRMLIPPELSSELRNKEVRLVLSPGRVEVITAEEFKKRVEGIAHPGDKF